MADVIGDFCTRFDKLYAKRAFAYWFVGEGLESGEMSCAREDWEAAKHNYQELDEQNWEGEE
jgi:tubulin alpha